MENIPIILELSNEIANGNKKLISRSKIIKSIATM
jgi:hypothetical protein